MRVYLPYNMSKLVLVSIFAFFMLAGCATKNVQPDAVKGFFQVDKTQLNSILSRLNSADGEKQSWISLASGINENIKYLSRKQADDVAVKYGNMEITWGMLARTNEELLEILPELDVSPDLLKDKFVWFALSPRTLLTGYYEPYLEASLTPDPAYPYPLYSVPADLKVLDLGKFHYRWKGEQLIYKIEDGAVVPYDDRKAIDFEGALKNKGFEVAWVKSLVDVFILQIQGSGRLLLADGSVKHILYAGKNGQKYVSLGKVLIDRGLMPKEGMSMQGIKQFLKNNPDLVEELLITNPSYVFFRLDDSGPYGAMNAPLTPMASVAVDSSVLPLGSMALLTTKLPEAGVDDKKPFTKIVMAQDRGGAIKGTRVDLFCGSGSDAEFLAGHLNSWSHIYIPVSREALNQYLLKKSDECKK
ncbi:murein transglycosylase A [Desulfovibrio gilichinskyi]|uniref:peptidoglycan lytic exotransglycosylase n=1 Tax=Desulfovibrio gilichinskyi TaxID=1519643 RepID=A0A1X7C8R0_9BACT|nr:MltA domain-containing protein [Desulfovibrio gilichinskyi]SME91965.1 membrane-bound lytic murein transglycosylase A [Desulfovibrio gilichinskyi]